MTERHDSLRKAPFSTAIRDGGCRLVSQPHAGPGLIGSGTSFKYNATISERHCAYCDKFKRVAPPNHFLSIQLGFAVRSGSRLNLLNESPTYEVAGMDHVPYVDVAATYNGESKQISLFVLNRDLSKSREVELVWEDSAPSSVVDSLTLTGDDLKALNSFEAPQRVAPRSFEKSTTTGTRTRLELPPRSYSMLLWSL